MCFYTWLQSSSALIIFHWIQQSFITNVNGLRSLTATDYSFWLSLIHRIQIVSVKWLIDHIGPKWSPGSPCTVQLFDSIFLRSAKRMINWSMCSLFVFKRSDEHYSIPLFRYSHNTFEEPNGPIGTDINVIDSIWTDWSLKAQIGMLWAAAETGSMISHHYQSAVHSLGMSIDWLHVTH